MEMQMRGRTSSRIATVNTAEKALRRAESARTSDTRCLQTASEASRPAITAPPTTTVRDIWSLRFPLASPRTPTTCGKRSPPAVGPEQIQHT